MTPTQSNLPMSLRLSALVLGFIAVAAAMLPLFQAAGAVIA
ncbi:MAG: hypothetical protein FD124_2108 [Alphaproteobacteria bacterium]|nr:MAG: hypothetical protein FD160_553 [Caulobacteraceae bacterium]TPW05521.1 MAG: hypothetical protein FD124_2108 [Alphaproteobacteria bacterium]